MADAKIYYDEIRFNVRDPEHTHVYVFIRGEGDCPFMVHGWHHKAYPSSVPTKDIMAVMWEDGGPVSWERQNPPVMDGMPMLLPHSYVPVQVEQLQAWRAEFAVGDGSLAAERADEITGLLTQVPDWSNTCPHCRAQSWLQGQIDEQQG